MYSAATSQFHKAVAENAPQMALLIFDGDGTDGSQAVFTNDDIDVSKGIEFRDYFNLEEDIAIGQATSNEISFSLFNDDRYLNDYKFGEFLATIGVLVEETEYQQTDGVKIVTTYATWGGFDKYPYVTRNGAGVSAQPSFAVMSLLGYNGKVYAFGEQGQMVVYNDQNGANITASEPKLNSFMKNKAAVYWKDGGIFYNKGQRRLYLYRNGVRQIYEFVPLGYFTAERPKAPDVIEIDMSCNDFMMKFDDDMPSDSDLGVSYPITFTNLLKKLCNKAGVSYDLSGFTINANAKLNSRPKEFNSSTMRDVVKWIAEAAAGNARFNRDGKLVIDWIRSVSQTLDEGGYESFNPYYYQTKQITKLKNRGSDGSYNKTEGSGKETYLIQDNPLLKGVG